MYREIRVILLRKGLQMLGDTGTPSYLVGIFASLFAIRNFTVKGEKHPYRFVALLWFLHSFEIVAGTFHRGRLFGQRDKHG